MARDEHRTIILRKDYRDFRSHCFNKLAMPLLEHLGYSRKNVLALVKGPPHISATSLSCKQDDVARYAEFNLLAIRRFIAMYPLYADACFYLKTHPSLGADSPLVEAIVGTLARHSIQGRNIWEGMQFAELSSIPAEACLATGKFDVLLSLDVSSALWHVGHDPSLACYMPLDAIVKGARDYGYSTLMPLLAAQRVLNQLNGNHVVFY
jgi:hypothetical protein